jgi:hypothetical protein
VKVGRDNFLIAQALLVMRRGRMRLLHGAAHALESCGLPAALLAVAAWDVCQPMQRKRSANKLRVESMAKKLTARYEQRITMAEAKRLIEDGLANGEAWIAEFATADRPSTDWDPRTLACPSIELEMSRRMVSYWRNHRRAAEARSLVRRLWRDAVGD